VQRFAAASMAVMQLRACVVLINHTGRVPQRDAIAAAVYLPIHRPLTPHLSQTPANGEKTNSLCYNWFVIS